MHWLAQQHWYPVLKPVTCFTHMCKLPIETAAHKYTWRDTTNTYILPFICLLSMHLSLAKNQWCMCSMLLLLHLQFAHNCTLLSLVPLLKAGKLQERPQPCQGGNKLATLNPISLPATHTTVMSTYIRTTSGSGISPQVTGSSNIHTYKASESTYMLIASSWTV